MRSELQRSRSGGLFHACFLQHSILRLRYAVLPHPVIILIDLGELSSFIDLDHHAHVACKLLAMRLDDHLPIRPDDVIGTAAVPDLLENGTFGCGMNRLSGSALHEHQTILNRAASIVRRLTLISGLKGWLQWLNDL